MFFLIKLGTLLVWKERLWLRWTRVNHFRSSAAPVVWLRMKINKIPRRTPLKPSVPSVENSQRSVKQFKWFWFYLLYYSPVLKFISNIFRSYVMIMREIAMFWNFYLSICLVSCLSIYVCMKIRLCLIYSFRFAMKLASRTSPIKSAVMPVLTVTAWLMAWSWTVVSSVGTTCPAGPRQIISYLLMGSRNGSVVRTVSGTTNRWMRQLTHPFLNSDITGLLLYLDIEVCTIYFHPTSNSF